MRAALYWVPEAADPLFARGSAWLGRDMRTGAPAEQPDIDGLAGLTADARHYGLHATLRPPMRLATRWEAFRRDAKAMTQGFAPFALPALRVCNVGGFLALRETTACPPLHALADACVQRTEAHRARAGAAELARRRAGGLTPRQDALLEAYGYPFVLDEWFFHVTLTRRLDSAEMARLRPLAARYFAPVLDLPRVAEGVCICVEEGGDFTVKEGLLF